MYRGSSLQIWSNQTPGALGFILFLFLIFLICFHIFIWRSSILRFCIWHPCACVFRGWKRTSCVLPSVSASFPWYRLSHRAWSKLWWSPSLQLPTPRALGLQTQLLLAFYMDAGTHILALTLNVLLPTESRHTLTDTHFYKIILKQQYIFAINNLRKKLKEIWRSKQSINPFYPDLVYSHICIQSLPVFFSCSYK